MNEQKRLNAFESGTTVREAVRKYLDHRKNDCGLKQTTVDLEKRRLAYLVDYCDDQGINTISELASHDPDKYRSWRRTDTASEVDALAESTVDSHMKTIVRFVKFARGQEDG